MLRTIISVSKLLKWPLSTGASNYARQQYSTIISGKIEEETLAWYSSERFYQVRIGKVYNARYRVVGKLGYGSCSTVWLCRDLKGKDRFVTMKVYELHSPQAMRELEFHRRLQKMCLEHQGSKLVRTLLDHFNIVASRGNHVCLIHTPLEMSLGSFKRRFRDHKLPKELLKLVLIRLLRALDFLHTEADVVHADLQESNILLEVGDPDTLSTFENDELSHPSPRKMDKDYIVYTSRSLESQKAPGRPVLCDFGEARIGSATYHEDIQPYIYRAPEIILRMRWDCKVDIWNLGVLIWDLFEDEHLFNARDENKQDSNAQHLAEMIAILGHPPKTFLDRSEFAEEFFDAQGLWKGQPKIPTTSLASIERNLSGSDQDSFLLFMQKMLQWSPEDRQSAKQLLADPWLRSS